MRQFILGTGMLDISEHQDFATLAVDANDGKLGVGYYPNGIPTFNSGAGIKDKGFLSLVRSVAKGGPVVLPLYKNRFSYTKMTYSAPAAFVATVTIPSPADSDTDYSIIAAKKGVKFNERNKWTATVHLKGGETATQIADKIVAYFMDGSVARYGISVANVSGTLTFTAVDGGDWAIIPCDDLTGTSVTVSTPWDPGKGTAAMVRDMADKAAADAGFEYTYKDAHEYLYPDYPLGSANSFTGTYVIFTLRFAEPREVKTVDEVVNQIIQVAIPSSQTSAITAFENACKYLSDIEVL